MRAVGPLGDDLTSLAFELRDRQKRRLTLRDLALHPPLYPPQIRLAQPASAIVSLFNGANPSTLLHLLAVAGGTTHKGLNRDSCRGREASTTDGLMMVMSYLARAEAEAMANAAEDQRCVVCHDDEMDDADEALSATSSASTGAVGASPGTPSSTADAASQGSSSSAAADSTYLRRCSPTPRARSRACPRSAMSPS